MVCVRLLVVDDFPSWLWRPEIYILLWIWEYLWLNKGDGGNCHDTSMENLVNMLKGMCECVSYGLEPVVIWECAWELGLPLRWSLATWKYARYIFFDFGVPSTCVCGLVEVNMLSFGGGIMQVYGIVTWILLGTVEQIWHLVFCRICPRRGGGG